MGEHCFFEIFVEEGSVPRGLEHDFHLEGLGEPSSPPELSQIQNPHPECEGGKEEIATERFIVRAVRTE
jgi:hypothetical protein